MARSAAPLSLANRASFKYRINDGHGFRACPTACPNELFGVAERGRTSSQLANVANSPRRHG